jgi:hypothetical protein
MVSRDTAEQAAKEAGLSPKQVDNVVDEYSDAQIDALQRAVLAASLFALVAFWLAADLPGAPLVAPAAPRAPPRAESLT